MLSITKWFYYYYFTPDTTYAGGGFKFGIIYYNTISWNLIKLYKGSISDITSEMKNKLKDNFVNNFGLKNVKFGNESIPDDYFRQNIKCQETGSFNEGDTLTTMCIVYLPNSVVEIILVMLLIKPRIIILA